MNILLKATSAGLIFMVALLAGGCALDKYDSVISKHSNLWTKYDCGTVITGATSGNLADKNAKVKVLALPFSPSVLTALTRLDQLKQHWTADQYMRHLEDQLAIIAGVLYESKADQYYDAKGNYLNKLGQLDRMVFMVEIQNTTWPCVNPILAWSPFGQTTLFQSLTDVPCYMPDITDLDQRIFLTNERMEVVRPISVYGKKNNLLTVEENLIIIFPVSESSKGFFEGTKDITLNVAGFDCEIKLPFNPERIR